MWEKLTYHILECAITVHLTISLLKWKDQETSPKMNSQWGWKPIFESILSHFNGHMLSISVDSFSTSVVSNVVSTRHLVFPVVSNNMGQTEGKHYFDTVWKQRDGKVCVNLMNFLGLKCIWP